MGFELQHSIVLNLSDDFHGNAITLKSESITAIGQPITGRIDWFVSVILFESIANILHINVEFSNYIDK